MTFSNSELLAVMALQLALTAAPGVASALLARRLGVRDVPVLLGIALAGSGLTALLAFWAYFADPWVGSAFANLTLLGSIGVAIWAWPRARPDVELLKQLATPLGLWAFASAFILFLGFLHGGMESPLVMSSTRFSGQLPSDNDIPHFFAEWFAVHGHQGSAPIFPPSWLSSDRPPLQVGYVLAQRTFGWDAATLHYQVLGVVVQQLWVVGLWALLLAARVRARTRGLIMVAVLVSDVAIVNGFFVWPKLLAASFLLAATALVVSPEGPLLKREPRTMVLAGCLCALAYLSHGSSVFGLIPLVAIAVARGLPGWRWVTAGIVAGLVLVGGWSAYQHYSDPPGDRLQKWMLAGFTGVDDRGVAESIGDSYADAGVGGALHNKAENFISMSGGGPAATDFDEAVSAVGSADFSRAAAEVRESRFLYLLPSLGLLLIALPFLVVARARSRIEGPDWGFARFCLVFAALGAVVWGLLLFGTTPARATIHVGSLAVPILCIAAVVAGLRATFPRLAAWLVAANIVTVMILYVPSLTPPEGTSYSAYAALVALAGLAGFAYLTLIGGAEESGAGGRSGESSR